MRNKRGNVGRKTKQIRKKKKEGEPSQGRMGGTADGGGRTSLSANVLEEEAVA